MCTPLFHGIQENDSFDAFVEGLEGSEGLKSLEKRRGQDWRRIEKPIYLLERSRRGGRNFFRFRAFSWAFANLKMQNE